MKYTILLSVILLLSSAIAYERLWAKGDVLLSELQNGRDELHVVVFYDSTNTEDQYSKVKENQSVIDEVIKYLNELDQTKQDPNLKVFFSTVDAADPYNQNIIFKSGVDPKELDNGPTILTLKHGKGFRQNGPKVLAAMKKSIANLTNPPQAK